MSARQTLSRQRQPPHPQPIEIRKRERLRTLRKIEPEITLEKMTQR